MKIAGLLPTSLQDYPGNISAVIFTQGCNFRCPYCHNPELVESPGAAENRREGADGDGADKADGDQSGDYFFPLEEVYSLLRERRDYLDGVVITGGEPTLQPDLISFLSDVVDMGYKIKLDTNGSRPGVLEELLVKDLIDMVAWDYKLPRERYPELTPLEDIVFRMNWSGEVLAGAGIPVEIRVTAVPGLVEEQDIEKIASQVAELAAGGGADNFPAGFYLQEFSPKEVLRSEYGSREPYPRERMQEFAALARNYLNEVSEVEIRGNLS